MKNRITAEVHVLDRILYLLEENSVGNLAEQDTTFADFIEHLYKTVTHEAQSLQQDT